MRIKLVLAVLTIQLVAFYGCIHDNFEEPPLNVIPEGTYLNLDQIYQIYNDSVLNLGNQSYKFTEDYSVTAVVVMDDKSGNIYKSAYIQDGTKGINLHLMSSGGLYEGDSVRVYLKGLVLSEYAGMMQLDSVDVDKNIIKIATLRDITPETVTIDQIFTGQYLAKVVYLENVQFSDEDLGTTYAVGAPSYITMNKTLVDENGQEIIVRNSGYASFAEHTIPEGRGSIIAVVGKYNEDWQLLLRSEYEINFDKKRFGDVDTLLFENFQSVVNAQAITLAGWDNIFTTGSLQWMGFNNGEDAAYAKIEGTGTASTTYLILPQQQMNNYFLSFQTRAGNLQNAVLEIVVSSDYDGTSSPDDFTWEVVPATFATSPASGYGSWTESGQVDLSSYNGNAYIAFRYSAEAGQKGVFLLDDILLFKE
ncbi:MAG TPA: DUF5689 domain-containing protein [Bacteroidales bacterium]|nr:DUF5689 domain-containing protein [Bacteroidales bacterium]